MKYKEDLEWNISNLKECILIFDDISFKDSKLENEVNNVKNIINDITYRLSIIMSSQIF